MSSLKKTVMTPLGLLGKHELFLFAEDLWLSLEEVLRVLQSFEEVLR